MARLFLSNSIEADSVYLLTSNLIGDDFKHFSGYLQGLASSESMELFSDNGMHGNRRTRGTPARQQRLKYEKANNWM